jgi:transcriptional regulator with XRE-family HTH domain
MTDKNFRVTIGALLKDFRTKRGISAYKVAKYGGLSITQVRRIEEGTTNLR